MSFSPKRSSSIAWRMVSACVFVSVSASALASVLSASRRVTFSAGDVPCRRTSGPSALLARRTCSEAMK